MADGIEGKVNMLFDSPNCESSPIAGGERLASCILVEGWLARGGAEARIADR